MARLHMCTLARARIDCTVRIAFRVVEVLYRIGVPPKSSRDTERILHVYVHAVRICVSIRMCMCMCMCIQESQINDQIKSTHVRVYVFVVRARCSC